MRIEILCTGDEVLSGKTVNTNYSHVARRLQEVGLDTYWGTTVGDDRASLVEAFNRAAARADAVIVNGGLGPTVDDLSQDVAAEAAGVGLELHEDWLQRIEAFYVARGRVMPPNNRKQAMLPVGAEFIDNPVGTACGFAIDIASKEGTDKARFFFTPGVPRELRRMLDDEIIPRLLRMSGTQSVVRLQRFHSFGLGESRVDNMLADADELLNRNDVRLGFQAHYPQLETKLFARGASEAEVDARMAPAAAAVRARLGNFLIAENDDTLEGKVLEALGRDGGTLAVAECGTHGAVSARLVAADGNGTVFQRGALGASIPALARALSIDPITVAGDSETALRVAHAVRQSSSVSAGLGIIVTGGDDPNEGVAHIGLSQRNGDDITRTAVFVGNVTRARSGAVEMALDCLRRQLEGLRVDEPIDFEKHTA